MIKGANKIANGSSPLKTEIKASARPAAQQQANIEPAVAPRGLASARKPVPTPPHLVMSPRPGNVQGRRRISSG